MALTDVAVRTAKPREKDYKVADSGGLYLLVTTTGGKLWRFKYRALGSEKKMSFGRYPEVSLADARKLRDSARGNVASGADPAADKKRERIAKKLSAETTFGGVALEYIEKAEKEGRAVATVSKLRWARQWLMPAIGHRPIDQIEPIEILAVLKEQERLGNLETAKRTRAFASRVFRYAVATARAKADPASLLIGAVAAPRPTHLAAIIEPERAGDLMRAIAAYQGYPVTRWALALSPHVFVRPGELRQAEWSEIDFEKAVWRIPAARMKQRRPHVVPLSRQAIEILKDAQTLTGTGRFVFPVQGGGDKSMSENTVVIALRRMGFDKEEMSAHGFRAMASTLLNESGRWSADAIERALSHKDGDNVRGAYHRGAHWKERVEMAQWWSNYLDGLRIA